MNCVHARKSLKTVVKYPFVSNIQPETIKYLQSGAYR